MELTEASRQWASRPDDQRYLTLDELDEAVSRRKHESWTVVSPMEGLELDRDPEVVAVNAYDAAKGEVRKLFPTHYAFGMLSQQAGAPAGYLRKLSPQLAAVNLQYGLLNNAPRDEVLVLGQSNDQDILRTVTSTSYGRIWDEEVVRAVHQVNEDGRWKVPVASYQGANPKRATTLYASDRDVFIFLVDPDHPVEVAGETMFRGFYTWNSEVGNSVFGLTTFLYRFVCDNRIIWGAEDIKELRIRHNRGAPERFAYEGAGYLRKYAEASTERTVATIAAAKRKELSRNETWADWLRSKGFSKTETANGLAAAEQEEGEARSLWDVINGLTASGRSIRHTDTRIDLETRAGQLLQEVAV